MADLTHLFTIGQKVKCNMDGETFDGIVKETFEDHIIVDVPGISNHCWFGNGVNIDYVYPDYNCLYGVDSDFNSAVRQEIRKILEE